MIARTAFWIAAGTLGVMPGAVCADVIFSETCDSINVATGLPPGWEKQPHAHAPFFSAAIDSVVYGEAPPSMRVDVPLHTIHYRLTSPDIPLPDMSRDYTLEFSLKVNQPNSPFQVDVIFLDENMTWTRSHQVMSLVGEDMGSMSRFRVLFSPGMGPRPGGCWLAFGQSYAKVLQEGAFWVDDVVLREGRHVEPLAFYLKPWSVAPGDDVEIHASCGKGSARVQVWREADRPLLVEEWTIDDLHEEPVPEDVWQAGCGWPVAGRIEVGPDWPSGLYTVKMCDGDQSVWESLVVRGQGGVNFFV